MDPTPAAGRATRLGRTRKRRADAERNIASIVESAIQCPSRHPDASMADIAAAAGVGRVTLYAHFPSREALLGAAIDQATTRVLAVVDAARIDEGPALDALERLIRAGWSTLDWFWGLHVAAQGQPRAFVREHSAHFLARIEWLVARGQGEGALRTDLPVDWLVTAMYALIHAAGEAVADGRLDPDAAADVLVATTRGLLAA